ncbi:MAG TPA: hypothetical protein VFU19_06200 [Iamia sp.]|nr:hypothetical protein [Iamia sp.]
MTTTDERLERYLTDRSATIDLPHAGIEAITRGARRRRRRRAVAGSGLAAALIAGGLAVALVQPAPEEPEEVGGVAAAVVDSPFDWSLVAVEQGLGWGSGPVSDGSAVYSLSTAAGPEPSGAEGRRLYRSEDGTDWEDVGLPDGLSASGVAAADGAVYAVGTTAAGGEVTGVDLAVSGDGGGGWDTSAVPIDLAALGDGFPGEVRITDAEVAVAADGRTVVAVSVSGFVDPAAVLPPGEDPDLWYPQGGGIVRQPDAGSCTPAVDPGGAASTTAPPPATTRPGTEGVTLTPEDIERLEEAAASGQAACPDGEAPRAETRSWAELGLTAEQAALADGQVHLFASDDDGALAPTHVAPGTSFTSPTTTRLLAADDGWWLVDQVVSGRDENGMDTSSDIVALHSADGETWTDVTVATDEAILATGVTGGRPMVVAIDQRVGGDLSARVHRIDAGGTVTTVDLNELLELPTDVGINGAGVGPLGVAVALGPFDGPKEVVWSGDGVRWSRQELPEPAPGTKESVNGITVTPDAIKVRLNQRDPADMTGGAPAGQRLFVGTPPG